MQVAQFQVSTAITPALIVIQCALFAGLAIAVLKRLNQEAGRIRLLAQSIGADTDLRSIKLPETQTALPRVWEELPKRREEVFDIDALLRAENLLPTSYNARLDAAAPGVFTAVGIVGTFFGLIVAFRHVDTTQAAQSIGTLINGMSTAFWNSLVGVILSIAWTLLSRMNRHGFDSAVAQLASKLHLRLKPIRPETAVFSQLMATTASVNELRSELKADAQARGVAAVALLTAHRESTDRVAAALDGVKAATSDSSRDLLDKLAPRLEQSFQALVNAPFERLVDAAARFESVLGDVSERHRQAVLALRQSTDALVAANNSFGSAIAHAETAVATLAQGAAQLESGVQSVSKVTEDSRVAAESLTQAAQHFAGVSTQHGELATALSNSVAELRMASGVISSAGGGLGEAVIRLDETVGRIATLSSDAAEQSISGIRSELTLTVTQMAEQLQTFGSATAAAYEQSSKRVIDTVDSRVSDLTDRISAELNTLSQRLPESVEEMTGAARDVRVHLQKAIRSLAEGVQQLEAGSRKSLVAQLEEYDKALERAVNHLSGTLATWDDRVGDLASAARDFKMAMAAGTELRVPGLPGSSPIAVAAPT